MPKLWMRLLSVLALTSLLGPVVTVFAAETVTYSYDALGRLKATSRAGTINNGVTTATTYDAASNRSNHAVTGGKVAPSFSIAPAAGLEGSQIVFTVTRAGDAGVAVSVNWATTNGTASAGSDFAAASGTLTFAVGELSKTISISTTDDAVVESAETFSVVLSRPSVPAGIATGSATGTINDNDATLAVGNASALEGAGLTFSVTRTGYSGAAATVSFATASGTAAAPGDFTAASGTVTFAAGETTRTVTVQTVDDSVIEPTETFRLTLSGQSSGLVPGTMSGTGTINDNDASYAISGATVAEGGTLAFVVTRTGYTAVASSVSFATSNGSAVAGSDYNAASGTLSFAPGQTSATINVSTIDDSVIETTETLTVSLSSPTAGATISAGSATGTILDNDLAFAIGNAAAGEGGTLVFTVTRQGSTANPGSVNFATGNGSAGAGSDYTATSGTLSFAAGQTSATITVATIDDLVIEPTETMVVNLSGATGGASISAPTGTGTITDNDSAFVIADTSALEGGTLSFTITRQGNTATAASVSFATANGSAVAGADFAASSGTVSFAPGQTAATVNIATVDDSVMEPAEAMTVSLSGATGGATVAGATATGTIIDNDSVLSISGASVAEGGTLVFTVSRSGYTANGVSVNFASANGSAIAGSDYTAVAGTLGFAPGQTSATIAVPTIDETLFEGDETLSVNLSAPSLNAAIATGSAIGTILNNDPPPPNQPPVANADSVTVGVCRGAWVNVVANDTDPEGDLPLVVLSVTGSSLATVTLDTASNQIRVNAYGGTGGEFVTYTVRDSKGASSQGLLAINVVDGTGCF